MSSEGYNSTMSLESIAQTLRAAQSVVVTTHAKPDGDAFGSMVALVEALRREGVDATGRYIPPLPSSLASLGNEHVQAHEDDTLDADLIAIVDTGAWSQLGSMRPELERRIEDVLIVDHHLAGDVAAARRYIDVSAAACCEIVGQLVELLTADDANVRDTFGGAIGRALYAGIASDTGWFRFSNTTDRTHEWAARLIRAGVDQNALYQQLELTERIEKLGLMSRALQSLRFVADGRAAIMVLRAEDFDETGARVEETERFTDLPQIAESVRLVAMITQPSLAALNGASAGGSGTGSNDLPIRVSFRSKPGVGAVNVSELAGRFGGGGHARAAGAKVSRPLDVVVEEVAQAFADSFTSDSR